MIKKSFAIICAVAFLASTVTYAQSITTNSNPTGGIETTGTVKEYTPDTVLILDTLAPNEPTQFKLSKSVVYIDSDGKTVDTPGLRKNQKVRVHFQKTAGENVADKVTLIKE